MLTEKMVRQCAICKEEFYTQKERQIYCSYDCYVIACKSKSKEYYAKLREEKIKIISKMCPRCHSEFESTSIRRLYCSHACYHDACLEKNREYMQKVRENYKMIYQNITACELCDEKLRYYTKRPRWCSKCWPLARRIKKQWGDVEMPE
jgi:hypothetical protein